MNYITTTQLRTNSSDLVELLMTGQSVELIHRSKVIGQIKPNTDEDPKVFSAKRIAKIVADMNLPKLSYKEREKRYRNHLMQKYGKGLS